jgi:glycosyltransferase involved in cell wall biosynthesis
MPAPNPLISIAMPFLNCEATLSAALQSILRQSYGNWELLLCDDGSSDGGPACARSFRDRRINLWSDGRTKGLAARLNECIDRARGDFIARMDADDIAYPARLEKQVAFLQQHPEIDLAGSHMLIFAEDGAPLGKRVLPCAHEDIVANPALSFGLAHPTWMGRAAWFRRYRYSAQAVRYEDIELLYRSYRHSRFANIPEILHAYREPQDGLRKRFKTRIERVRFLWRSGNPGAYQSTLVEPIKAMCDAALVTAGLRYRMLRSREQSLTAAEFQDWDQLFATVTQPGAPAPNPQSPTPFFHPQETRR